MACRLSAIVVFCIAWAVAAFGQPRPATQPTQPSASPWYRYGGHGPDWEKWPPQSQPASQASQPNTRSATGAGGGAQDTPTQQAQWQRRVDLLKKVAERLRSQQQYDEALEVVEQILTVDQSNCWAANKKQELVEYIEIKKDVAELRKRQAERAKEANARDANTPWYGYVNGDSWKLRAAARKEAQTPPANEPRSDAAIREKLKREIKKLSFTDLDLRDVLTFLHEYSGVDIQVNWRALGQVGIEPTRKVSMDYRNVTVKHALDRVLIWASNNVEQESEPRYLIQGGVLLISTKADLEKIAQTRPAEPQSQPISISGDIIHI